MNTQRTEVGSVTQRLPETVVYFMLSGGLIKIGFTSNLPKRWNELDDGSAIHVELLFTLDGGSGLEGQIHKRFASSRRHGEWFEPTDDLMTFIEKMDEFRQPGTHGAADVVRMNARRL